MKTQLIQLVNHDDLISIRDRMAWAKTPRILLMWPKRGRVEIRPLDMALLKRHAESLGAELGVVTRSREIKSAARRFGISVFSKPSDAQKKSWIEKRSVHPVRRFPRTDLRLIRAALPVAELFRFTNRPLQRLIVFGVGVLSVFLIMLVLIPSAEIKVNLPAKTQEMAISVNAVPDVDGIQISGVVPQRELTLVVEGNASALSTGSLTTPDGFATGEVQLINLTNKAVNLPEGTPVITSAEPSISFVTSQAVDVPAGKGKTGSVNIRATTPGPDGNVHAGAITILEGAPALLLNVANIQPTTGGSIIVVPQATDQDRESLKKRLLSDLQRGVMIEFPKHIAANDILFPKTISLNKIVEEIYSPAPGEVGDKVSLLLRAEFRIAFSSFSDLHLLSEQLLDASLPTGFVPLPGEIEINHLPGFAEGQNVIRWEMQFKRKIQPVLESGTVISIVQGKFMNNAKKLLTDKYGLEQPPLITIQPGWWPWLPFLPIRISVRG